MFGSIEINKRLVFHSLFILVGIFVLLVILFLFTNDASAANPSANGLNLLYHNDGEELYAGYQYTWQANVSDDDGATDIYYVQLRLDDSGDDQRITWWESNDTFESNSKYFTVDSTSADSYSFVVGPTSYWIINFTITLHWNWTNADDPTPLNDDRLEVRDDSLTLRFLSITSDSWKCENELRIYSMIFDCADAWESGTGYIVDNDWLRGGTSVTARGIITYEDTTNVYPPLSTGITAQLWTDGVKRNTYSDALDASGNYVISAYTIASGTDADYDFNISVENIPNGGSHNSANDIESGSKVDSRIDGEAPNIDSYDLTETSDYLFYNSGTTTLYYGNDMSTAQSFTVSGTASDTGGSTLNVTTFTDLSASLGAPGNDNSPANWAGTYNDVDSGDVWSGTITVTVYDFVGNSDTQQYTITRDISNPTINSPSVTESSNYIYATGTTIYYGDDMSGTEVFTVDGGSSDGSGSGLFKASFSSNPLGSPSDDSSPNTWVGLYNDVTNVDTWTGTITVTVYDMVNNSNNQTFTVNRDIISPSFTSASAIEASNYIFIYNTLIYYGDDMSSAQSFTLQGTSTDSGAGLLRATFSSNPLGSPSNDNSPANWQGIYNSVESGDSWTGTIIVTLTDRVGNTNTTNFTVYRDTTDPGIVYIYPTAGSDTIWYRTDPGKVIDINFTWGGVGNAPLDYAQYQIDSGGWQDIFSTDRESNFTDDWNISFTGLSDGVHAISIKVIDTVGNEVIHTYSALTTGFNLRKDTTPPSIIYNNPSAGGDSPWYSGANQGNFVNIDFGWLSGSPLDYAQYRIGTGAWINIFTGDQSSDYTQNWGLNWASVPEGVTQISIRVFDLAGNNVTHTYTASVSGFRVRKDITPPGITYNSPGAGENTSWYSSDPGTIINIDFIWIANSPLVNASYRINSGPWVLIFNSEISSNYNTEWSLNWSMLAEGLNEIHIRAYDKAGNKIEHFYNVDTTGFAFKKDTTPPNPSSFTINSDAQYTNSTSVTFTISASDTGSGIYQMRFSTDGVFDTEPWETYSTTKLWTLTGTDGTKTIYVQFRDNALVISTAIFDSILLDTLPPTLGNWTMNPGNVNEDTEQVLNITVKIDDLLGSGIFLVEVNYTIDGVYTSGFITMEQLNSSYWRLIIDPSKLDSGSGTGYTWDQLQGKTIRYTVRVTDNAGNIGISTERTEFIDPVNDPPVITNEDELTATEGELYNVSYLATDIDPLGDTLTWSLDSNAGWLSIDPTTGLLSGTPGAGDAGVYYVNVTVSDGKGGFDWHYFLLTVKSGTIINKNPVITTANVLTIEAGNQYSVDYQATDDHTPVANLIWSLETNASWLSINPATGVLSGTPQLTDVGTYWVKVTVGDGEGGFASTNFTLRVTKPQVINKKPTLTDGNMEPSSGDTDTQFTFSVIYTDEDNDPGQVWVWVDGSQKSMMPDTNDDDYTDGVVFTFKTKLSEGTHGYYFTASDGTDPADPGDNTPTNAASAISTSEIKKPKPKDGGEGDQTLMYAGIVIIVIIILVLLLFMFMRSRGKGAGEEESELDRPGKPKVVGPVDVDEVTEVFEGEEEAEPGTEEYPYEGVSEPGGYEELETGELAEEVMAETAESDMGISMEGEVQISKPLKPAVETLELEDKMEIIELGLVMPCSVCQGIMPAGENVFQCTCGLVSHKGCVSGVNVCPQCGKEITIPELKAEPLKKKLPMIRKETKRELEEQKPPTKAFFIFIPNKTPESELAKYLGTFFKNNDLGNAETDDDLRFVRLFITPESAKIMLEHCFKHGRKKEVMGLMIGQTFHYKNEVFSIVKNVVTSELDATEVNVKFDSFEKLFDQLDGLDYEYQIIGWYHSHPSYTSFMSPTDADTQRRMFKHPYQYAIVIDPIKNDMNAFTLDQIKQNRVKEKPFAIIELE